MIQYECGTETDIPDLVALRVAYIREDFGTLSSEDEAHMRAELPAYFSEHLNQDLIAFLAKEEGKTVSVALLLIIQKPCHSQMPHGRIGEVLSVYTLPAFRRQGIARKNMQYLVDYAKEHTLDSIRLIATKDGYSVYRKVGFQEKHSKYTEMQLIL